MEPPTIIVKILRNIVDSSDLHGVSEEAPLVPAEDVPDVGLLPPHPQLVAPPGVHSHHQPDQSELSRDLHTFQ